MNIRPRAFLLSLTIIAVMVFSAVGPTVAYADGETPPEAAATEPAVEPTQPETGTADKVEISEPAPAAEGEATSEPAKEAAAPAEEAAPATEAAPAEPGTAEVAAPVEAPILDAVPENTTVTVLSAEGAPQPLATQAAADAIATTTDPIWCPAGQAPGTIGCTPSFPSFTALLNHLNTHPEFMGAGTIYVEQGAYQGGETTVDFNNYQLSNIHGSALTITGGWDPVANTTTSVSTLNNVSIVIGSSANPWGGSLAIENITINNTVGTGLTLSSAQNIDLNNVIVTNSQNGAGADLDAGGNVTIESSTFGRNKTAGATIRAGGSVTVIDSVFSNPPDARRQNVGLNITSTGRAVTLVNVVAEGNRRAGAHIDAAGFVTIVNSIFSGTKEIAGADFLGYGLEVITQDGIALDTVTANDNFLWGASLTAHNGDIAITNSNFNGNTTESPGFIDDTGLFILGARNVTIANSHADQNRLFGATITATGDVSITDSTFFSNDGITLSSGGAQTFHGEGLRVITSGNALLGLAGNITLTGVNASENTLYGAHLDAAGDVTVTDSIFTGSATGPQGKGLEIIADGTVFLDTVTLANNGTFGANIQAGGDVFLDSVTATNNGTNGVEVQANCTTVFLINGTYTGNGQYGLSIVNGALNRTGGVFTGNGLGEIFQDPGTCVFATTPPAVTPPTTGNPGATPPTNTVTTGTSQQGVNSLAQTLRFSTTGSTGVFKTSGGTLSAKNAVTLNSFLANSQSANGAVYIGLFGGKYAIVYFSDGSMQIIALAPDSLDELAMNGS